jgi:NADH-quinone oxidoreductase subunit A
MTEYSQISEFGKILIFLIMGILFVLAAFISNKIIAPKKPNEVKNSSYECGEEVIGSSWVQFNSRFYVIALIFLLFDVEMIFIFPWATVFSDQSLIAIDSRWGWLSFFEMMVFILILMLGLVYVWKKKDLNWIRPIIFVPKTDVKIPMIAYEKLNTEEYVPYVSKNVHQEIESKEDIQELSVKPKFIPRFKKS